MPMGVNEVKVVAGCVRRAFEKARDAGEFYRHRPFDTFPRGCCGMVSAVLGQYLRTIGIDTIWVSATRDDWSHAWLVLNDGSVQPSGHSIGYGDVPAEVQQALSLYGAQLDSDGSDNTFYLEDDLSGLTVVDITGDQFPDYAEPVYVGPLDVFHRSFEFLKALPCQGLQDRESESLYSIMNAYL